MRLYYRIILLVIICCCLGYGKTSAQADFSRTLLVKSLSEYILKWYISEELAKKMTDTIQYKLAHGLYDPSLNADEFAWAVTLDLRRISNDLHIDVWPAFDRNVDSNKIKKISMPATQNISVVYINH